VGGGQGLAQVNKAILVPAALAISAFAPWAITPLLMMGGAFLCYEGFEKLAHKYLHSAAKPQHAELAQALADPVDLVAWKRTRSRARCAPTSSCRPKSS
jgi:predicted DNA repair protein MutK